MTSRPVNERAFVLVYLAVSCLTLAHAVYLSYGAYFVEVTAKHGTMTQQEYYRLHNTIALSADHPLFRGEDHAPDQYRIGVEYAGKFIADRSGITKYYIVFAVFDFFCAMAAGLVAYDVLAKSPFFLGLERTERSLAVALLLGFLAYPFAWVVPWQRPETLPSALYLIGSIALLGRLRTSPGRGIWLVLFAAELWQCFVRADIPLTLGVAVLILAPSSRAKEMFGSRRACLVCGGLLTGVAIAVQMYLKMLVFPRATYPPDTAIVQLGSNLGARQLIQFGIAMAPWCLVVALTVKYRRALDPADVLAVLASIVYLPLWCVFGIVAEARLFVPFLLAMTPTMAKAVLTMLQDARRGRASEATIPPP